MSFYSRHSHTSRENISLLGGALGLYSSISRITQSIQHSHIQMFLHIAVYIVRISLFILHLMRERVMGLEPTVSSLGS